MSRGIEAALAERTICDVQLVKSGVEPNPNLCAVGANLDTRLSVSRGARDRSRCLQRQASARSTVLLPRDNGRVLHANAVVRVYSASG